MIGIENTNDEYPLFYKNRPYTNNQSGISPSDFQYLSLNK